MEILTQAFSFLINIIYEMTNDYGITIVIITLAIRSCLIPLNCKQRKQMKQQKEASRQIEEIKAKCGNDKEKLNRELQEYYQKNGSGMGSCLLSFLQLPVMIGLYNAIQAIMVAGATTVLLPWVASILVRDQTLILPIATIIVQLLPQAYPYLRFFKAIELQKASLPTILILLFANSLFVFTIPSGIGLYYFVSGLFTALEQFFVNIAAVKKVNVACTE